MRPTVVETMALSTEHAGLVALFQNRPELALELVRDVLGIETAARGPAHVLSVDLTDAGPVERRADFVVQYRGGRGLLIVVEVQRRRSESKRYSWPAYVVLLRARFRCEVLLLVVAPDPAVGRWCRQPIALGNGAVFTPLVVSAELVPAITDAADARARPELGLLSAIAHGKGEPGRAIRIARAMLSAIARLDEDRGMVYLDELLTALGSTARKAIMATITQGYVFKSEYARKYIEKGKAEGRAEGKAEGRAEGKAEGKAAAIVAVLEARGLSITRAERALIAGCTDVRKLDRWLRRAVRVERAADLFG